MPAPQSSTHPWLVAAFAMATLLPSCASPQPIGPSALEAPVVSPPAHATVEERIQYWNERLPAMGPEDRAEAHLCLGELHLESGNASAARISFKAARNGYLSKTEDAQVAWGLGRAYLLDDQADAAVNHLRLASLTLGGPEGDECRYLLAFAQGRAATSDDPGLLARVERYTVHGQAHGAGHHGHAATASGSASDLIDVARRDWGANRMLPNHDRMETPYRITVHHTAEPADTHSLDAAKREMRDLQRMHQQGNGWADLGYHFLIDHAGRVHEGRPINAQGAHAGNSDLNRGNIGICLIGNFVAQPERGSEYSLAERPTNAQYEALDALIGKLQARYSISDSQIWAHSHLKETACPGPELLNWVSQRRSGR